VGEWNRARIVVQGRHVEHWLNGFKTVEYERGTQMWRALVDHSKYVVWPAFGEATTGHVLLQDHGNRVSFRSVKIRELTSLLPTWARLIANASPAGDGSASPSCCCTA
jgi:metallophosphoesterase superfamily enzyme